MVPDSGSILSIGDLEAYPYSNKFPQIRPHYSNKVIPPSNTTPQDNYIQATTVTNHLLIRRVIFLLCSYSRNIVIDFSLGLWPIQLQLLGQPSSDWHAFHLVRKLLSMAFYYIHRSIPCSVIIRETSSYSIWELPQRPTAGQYSECERPWNTQS